MKDNGSRFADGKPFFFFQHFQIKGTTADSGGWSDGGAMYGIHRSSDNPLQSSLSPHTRIGNLLLTGQDVNFHGMVGTSLTAILTAEAIVGRNIIVEQINKE